jgi:predicted nucleotidyltransferase
MLIKNNILAKQKRLLSIYLEDRNAKAIIALAREEHVRFKEIPLKVYYLIMDFSRSVAVEKRVEQAYLFGSYSKLIYTEKSDVDLAIVLDENNVLLEKSLKRLGQKLENKYKISLELHFFTKNEMKQKDKLISEILKNGVKIF